MILQGWLTYDKTLLPCESLAWLRGIETATVVIQKPLSTIPSCVCDPCRIHSEFLLEFSAICERLDVWLVHRLSVGSVDMTRISVMDQMVDHRGPNMIFMFFGGTWTAVVPKKFAGFFGGPIWAATPTLSHPLTTGSNKEVGRQMKSDFWQIYTNIIRLICIAKKHPTAVRSRELAMFKSLFSADLVEWRSSLCSTQSSKNRAGKNKNTSFKRGWSSLH